MIRQFLDKYAIPEWREAHKLWSVRVAVLWAAFWGAFGGVLLFLPALQGVVPNWLFFVLCIVMSVTFAVARVTNQPGVA